MGLECRLVLRPQLSELTYEQSVFVKTQEKLDKLKYQKALKFIADKRVMRVYRSMADFVFCETFQAWKPRCKAYYNNKGPLLINDPHSTPKLIKAWDIVLSDLVLEMALINMNEHRARSNRWLLFRRDVHKILNPHITMKGSLPHNTT